MERRRFLKDSAKIAGGMAMTGMAINPAEQDFNTHRSQDH